MSDTEIFWKVVIPTAGPGIASGTILTFARALGEYGATSMLAGNIPGKTGTISQKVANGHSGRRLYDSGRVGCDCHGDCIPSDLPDESDLGQENEECQEVVRDGDRSKDSEKTEYI